MSHRVWLRFFCSPDRRQAWQLLLFTHTLSTTITHRRCVRPQVLHGDEPDPGACAPENAPHRALERVARVEVTSAFTTEAWQRSTAADDSGQPPPQDAMAQEQQQDEQQQQQQPEQQHAEVVKVTAEQLGLNVG